MVRFGAETHPGRVAESNEDSIGWDTDRRVWLVADGMGGHAKGEVASRLVKETILERVSRELPLKQSILDAHRVILEAARQTPDQAAMGSTVVALQVRDRSCDVVWVGDSRAYLWRNGRIRRVSKDHSYLEMLLAKNVMSEAEARQHPQRHLVVQTLGMGEPAPSEEHLELRKRDWLLLCSDGLTDELTDDEIAEHLQKSSDPKQAVDSLLESALGKGGHDNISVVIVESEGARRSAARWLPVVLGVLGGLLVFLLLQWLVLR